MEKDDEVVGNGNEYDFGARIYNPRLGRFLSIDPDFRKYADQSPYDFAVNDPIRMIDVDGKGPGDRVKAAKNLIGKTYSQEAGKNTGEKLRAGFTKEALDYQDCSELVCRVLNADGITAKVETMTSGGIKTYLEDDKKFDHTAADGTPKVGDIAVWDGHVGIVSEVDKNGKFKLVHAAGKGKGVLENPHFTTADKYRSSTFHGFYRPKTETADGKESAKSNATPVEEAAGTTTTGATGQGSVKAVTTTKKAGE
jgi:RHS repeat-associated protein